MGINRRLQEKYQIDTNTWRHLQQLFWQIAIVSPLFFAVIFALITWMIRFADSDISWLPYLLFPWMLIFISAIFLYRQFLTQSKITSIIRASVIVTLQYTLFICVIAGAFELLGYYGIYLSLILLFISIYLFYKWNRQWEFLWHSNKNYNEKTAIDSQNGRYKIMLGFKYDDNKAKKRGYKPFLGNVNNFMGPLVFISIAIMIGGLEFPFGPIQVYFSYWFCIVYFFLAFTYATSRLLHTYGKIVNIEKSLGKLLINGLFKG